MKPTIDIDGISLRKAALIAGLIVFIPTAPFAEFFVMQKLVVHGNIVQTVQNIKTDETLLIAGIISYLFTYIYDILLAWALYIFLVPVNRMTSLLTAWFRIIYTVIVVLSLPNLMSVLHLVNTAAMFEPSQLHAQISLSLNAFHDGQTVGFIFFGIYLALLGCLVFRSGYIPRLMGILLIIAGIGYLVSSLKRFLFPHYNLDFIMITFFGELIFTLWLLIKGTRIQESDLNFNNKMNHS